MLAEFVEKLSELSRKASSAEVVRIPGLDRTAWLRHGNELRDYEIPPEEVTVEAESLDSFSRKVLTGEKPEVYVSRGQQQLHAWLDHEERLDSVSMRLPFSDRWSVACREYSLTPREAKRLLRFELHGVGAEKVLSSLQTVDFSRKGSGRSTSEHGRESLGRSVEAEVQAADDVPETFRLSIPVYDGGHEVRALSVVEVTMGVFIDFEAERVVIRMLSDEASKAFATAQEAIAKRLSSDMPEVPVYLGRP